MNAKDVDRSLKDIQSQKCPFLDGVIGHHTLSRPISVCYLVMRIFQGIPDLSCLSLFL